MYHHVILECKNSLNPKKPKYEIKTDIQDIEFLRTRFIDPYEMGESILIDGKTYDIRDVNRIRIYKSQEDSKTLEKRKEIQLENDRARTAALGVSVGYFPNPLYAAISDLEDVTDNLITVAKGTRVKKAGVIAVKNEKSEGFKKVFIVHGRDEALIHEVQNFLYKLSLEGIVLNQHLNQGKTIIQKLLDLALDPQVGFGIVLYTPDDFGQISKELEQTSEMVARARQNVIFEHGLLVGKLGMSRVIALKKSDQFLEMPNDLSGVIYEQYDSSGSWKYRIAKEMRAQGYDIDLNNI